MFSPKPAYSSVLLGILLAASLSLILPATASAQDEELFNTASIERSVVSRFKLSKNDQKLVHAAIERENRVLVLSFLRFSESNTDFLCLWNKVRVERHEAEAAMTGLSAKQRTALARAREEVERRVLQMWTEDYVSGLTDLLELDRVQMDCISKVFKREFEQRRSLLMKESDRGILLHDAWERITDERNSTLKSILDPLQLHDYILLYAANKLIA